MDGNQESGRMGRLAESMARRPSQCDGALHWPRLCEKTLSRTDNLYFGKIEPDRNITFQHRLAAFPAELSEPHQYPILGTLMNITAFPKLASTPLDEDHERAMYACEDLPAEDDTVPIAVKPRQPHSNKIALVLRGECSFSHKVRVAQARGAVAVLVADDVLRKGEMDEEGRDRDGLLTMFSPGTLTYPSSP